MGHLNKSGNMMKLTLDNNNRDGLNGLKSTVIGVLNGHSGTSVENANESQQTRAFGDTTDEADARALSGTTNQLTSDYNSNSWEPEKEMDDGGYGTLLHYSKAALILSWVIFLVIGVVILISLNCPFL